MADWLRLIRWKNLLIVFFTQLLVWYCLVYDSRNMGGGLQLLAFLHLAMSTVLIAAAGYIINDYFDIKIDIINRPEKVIIEKSIPLRAAIIAHTVLNILGFLLAAVVAVKAHHLEWLLVQVTSITLLWFYSTDFKRQFVTGNLVVALLTALTIIVLDVYKPGIGWTPTINDAKHNYPLNPSLVLYGYAFFAFMLTWIREVVKDMEDFKGDAEQGCVTMPIKMGLQFSTAFTQTLGVVTLLCIGSVAYYLLAHAHYILGLYLAALICAPLTWWCYFINRTHSSADYKIASRWLKIIMVSGICSIIVYHFTNNITA